MRLLTFAFLALPIFALGYFLADKGQRERQPSHVPAVATPEPVNWLEYRLPVGHQHVPEVRTVTF